MPRSLVALAFAILAVSACSLANVHHDNCSSDAQCATAFGAGSLCSSGFCTTPKKGDCKPKNPQTTADFENGCTDAVCTPFDNKTRVTKLGADGSLPPLP